MASFVHSPIGKCFHNAPPPPAIGHTATQQPASHQHAISQPHTWLARSLKLSGVFFFRTTRFGAASSLARPTSQNIAHTAADSVNIELVVSERLIRIVERSSPSHRRSA